MCRKLIFLISLVFVISLANSASASTFWYVDRDVNDHLWSSYVNWSASNRPGEIPTVEDGARAEALIPDTNTCIVIVDANNTTAVCDYYRLGSGWVPGESSCWAIIDGGTLFVRDYLNITHYEGVPLAANCNRLIVNSGTVNVGGEMHVAHWDDALLQMNGGELNVGTTLWISYYNDSSTTLYAHIQLDAGVIKCGDLNMRYEDPDIALGTMDITGGKMVITMDRRDRVATFMNDGWITAYNGRGAVNVGFNDPCTILTGTADFGIAWGPSPENSAKEVDARLAEVKWAPGDWANKHTVYIGTSIDDANASATPVSVEQDANSYPVSLIMGQTYYWRIDEVNDVNDDTWTGNVWNFAVGGSVPVEAFEYGDYYELIDVWRDYYYYNGWYTGKGSEIDLETTIVHDANFGGSLKFTYKNDGYDGYSEIDRSFDPNENWSGNGIEALDVWFRGTSTNSSEQMYVGVRDESGTYGEVTYPGNPNDLKLEEWQSWSIDVEDFGVNRAKIAKLYIGFRPGDGGLGTVYFDDIAAYPCRPAGGADLNDDCLIDAKDLAIFVENWLETPVR